MKEYSIYIHIPFCISKCLYCDFNSYANKEDEIKRYVETLIKQIDNDNNITKEDICKTIYIGGGTPSYIDSKYIVEILNHIYNKYNIYDKAEITIEQNPCSMSKQKLKDYYDIGINRLSIGLQTTNNNLLKLIGRKHTYEEFLKKYNLARECGFANINIDLMLGLPNQSLDELKCDIENIVKLQPEHISCYSLIVYENTPMHSLKKDNNYIFPDDELERQMYYLVVDTLKDNGYSQYEISNFCKQNRESKHNLMCWNQYEYIGFGAGAHSFINSTRFQNVDNLDTYINKNNIVVLETMNEKQLMNEYMILGLRLINSIDSLRFKQKYNKNMFDVFNNQINFLSKNGYILVEDTDIRLTRKGIDYNNFICEQFIL